MDTKTQEIHDYDQVNFIVLENMLYRVFYHFVIEVADKSSVKSIPIYVNTNKGDHHLFETWDMVPPSDTTTRWAQVSDKDLAKFA